MSPPFEGTPRYFAWLYSSARMQSVLQPLFGIEAEISAALAPGLEHNVSHIRTSWWADEVGRLKEGHAVHPLTRDLIARHPTGSAAAPDLSGLVDVASWDLASAPFDTGAELAGYCDRWARALPQLAAVWSAPDSSVLLAQQFGYGVGVAVCEIEMLITLEDSARRGRLRIPLDELTSLGVPSEAVAHTPWPAPLSERLRARHQQLRGALEQSCALLVTGSDRAALRGLLVWAAVMHRHSQRAEAALPRNWHRSRLNGLGDALQAWRSARQAMRP